MLYLIVEIIAGVGDGRHRRCAATSREKGRGGLFDQDQLYKFFRQFYMVIYVVKGRVSQFFYILPWVIRIKKITITSL